MQLRDRVVWVTGASSGIGEALAVVLAGEGARLVLSARREDALRSVAERCGGDAERVRVLPLDLGSPETLEAKANEALGYFGQVDVLVNNAGVSQRALALETDWRVDEQLMRVNWLGTVALTKAVLPSLVARGDGHIVVVSSVAGKLGTPMRSAYSASKFALQGFFDALRAETAHLGIAVTLVVPGFVQTQISVNALTGDGTRHGAMDELTAAGISGEACARRIVRGIVRREREVVIAGAYEQLGLAMQRVAPGLLAWRMRNAKVT